MDEPAIGHNGGPELNERKTTIRTAWAKALFADPETPVYVMAMAWAIHWFSKADGTGAALSNEQFMAICGISEPSATRGKRWLRDKGYVHLQVGTGNTKTQFKMAVPPQRVITQTTQPGITQGNHTEGPPSLGSQSDDPGNHTDDPRVIPGLGRNLYRDSGTNQERRADKPRRNGSKSYWQDALNPEAAAGVDFEDGKLTLRNGAKAKWLDEFGGDERRLQLALTQVAPKIQPNSPHPILMQIEAGLARIAAEKIDRDERYAQAAKAKQPPSDRPPRKTFPR